MAETTRGRGQGRATIADVARHANVSAMTVSRVVNAGGNVRAATRERVEQAIRALQYVPNPAARSLASAEAARVGMLYNNPSASYLGELLIGALEQTGRIGGQLVLERCADAAAATESLRKLIAAGVDGILLPPPLSDSAAIRTLLTDAAMPFVLIASGRPAPGAASISIDDHAAAHAMTHRLIAQGHRAIGFVRGSPDQTASAERERGYRAALSEAGITACEAWIAQGYFTYQSGVEAAASILAVRDRPTAIFASNDDMAAGVSAMAHRLRLDVPRDLAIAGFDDTQLALAIFPALTTIRQPIARMGSGAVDLLLAEIRHKRQGQGQGRGARPDRIRVAFELIERGSTLGE